jgi:hypothetical protein
LKKIKLLALIALSIALLSGCARSVVYDPDEGVFEMWFKTYEKINAADSIELKIDELYVIFDNNEDGFEVSNVGTVKQVIHSDDDIDIELSFKINSAESSNKLTGYYTDGYMYYNFQDSKSKRATDVKSAKREVYADMLDLSALKIMGSSVTEVKGGRMLRFILDGNADVFEFTTDSIIQAFSLNSDQAGAKPTTIKIQDNVIYNVEIGNDYALKNITMAFTADISFMGGNLKTYYELKTKVVKTGGVTVQFPADLDEYTDISRDKTGASLG